MSDRNQISINCDEAGNVFVNGDLMLAHDLPRLERVLFLDDIWPNDSGISDSLKFSGARNVTVIVNRIVGGLEDCIDINNRCQDIEVRAGLLDVRGRYACTIKGESRDIRINVGKLLGHGSETDFDLGNRSEQASGRTRGVSINVVDALFPVRVRVMHAWKPTLSGGPFEVDTRLMGWIAKFFWIFPLLF